MFNTFRKPWVALLCLWVIVGALAAYIRLYPLWGHLWSPSQELATMTVVYNLKNNFLSQIHAQYPQMSLEEANQIATLKLNETMHKEKKHLLSAIEKANDTIFKERKESDRIYLLEADPFYFYNLLENIATTGKMATVIKGHQYFNPLMGAPFGYWQPLSLHPYVGFIVYKIAQIFTPSIKLITAAAFTPIVITVGVIGVFIWCGRLFQLSTLAIGLSSLYFAFLPVFLKRSALGWFDTDPYNVLFTLIFFCLLFKSLQSSTTKKQILFGVLSGINLICFSLIWQGWIFLLCMNILSITTIMGYEFLSLKKIKPLKPRLIFIASALGSCTLIGSIIYGVQGFFTFFAEGSSELNKFTNKGLSLWPNLFMEVGELKKSNITDILSDTGGPVFLGIAILGIVSSGIFIIKKRKELTLGNHVVVLFFLLVTFVLTLKATRFVIFMLIPLSLLFGYAITSSVSMFKFKRFKTLTLFTCAALLILHAWVSANYSIRNVLTPIYNDTWNDNLTAIRQGTPTDAIINTWWSPGHFIKAIAKRRVMFDGASLSENKTAYWMAQALLSTDEDQARGILRMLNSSGNKATEFLIAKGLKTSRAVELLSTIASQSKVQAQSTLSSMLAPADIKYVLSLTHGAMPHSYLLLYNEIIEQNIGIVFVGRQNFKKIESINDDPQLLASAPKPNSKDFINYLWDIAGGPSKFSEAFPLAGQDDSSFMFASGLKVSMDFKTASVNSSKYGQGKPISIVYLKDGQIQEQKIPGGNLTYSAMIYTQDNQMYCRFIDQDLAKALMIKLFFYNGEGMKYFKLFKSSSDLTSRTLIKTFKVE